MTPNTAYPAQETEEAAALVRKIQGGYIPQDVKVSGMPEGLDFREHQRASVAFAALTKKCLILDVMGLGKTVTGGGLLKYLDDRGKLGGYPGGPRAIVLTTAPNVLTSWKMDGFDKFFPDIPVGVARGTKKKRLEVYNDPNWKVLLIGYETLRNDVDWVSQLDFEYAIFDEVDVLGSPDSLVTKAVRRVTGKCSRRVGMTGTLITDRTLMRTHCIFEVLGIDKAFAPNRTHFSNYYHNWERKKQWVKQYNKRTRKMEARQVFIKEFKSLKNANEFRETLRPFYIRRTREDVSIKVPEMRHITRYLEPTKEQDKLYRQARQGFIKLGPNSPPEELDQAWSHLKSICINTCLVGGKDSSAKMDWLQDRLKGEWSSEKVVVFVNRLDAVAAFCKRLDQDGIGYRKLVGASTDKQRQEALTTFREDPDCKVFIGTRTLVRGLNLQVARIQVNFEVLPNPGEQSQVAGRVVRDGSLHDECLIVTLLIRGTLEHAWYKYVSQKQAVSNFMLGETNKIFASLSPAELFTLIKS